jgi:multidrug efflux pump subunit AcrB/ABC-type multidrug transport system ATPase subunit
MSLSGLAVRRPVATAMLFLAVSLLGLVSLNRLPVELMPTIVYPEIFVSVSLGGSSPEAIERELIMPVEAEISRLAGLTEMTSQARLNRGSVRATFAPGTDMKHLLLQVQARMERLRPALPDRTQITVQRYDANDLSSTIMELQVLGRDADLNWLRDYAEERIRPALEAVEGVVSARVLGGRQSAVEVIVDPVRLQAHRLTLSQIGAALNNFILPRTYLGLAYDGSQALPVSFSSQAANIGQLAQVPVKTANGLRLGDVASIGYGLQESTDLSRVNGLPAVGVVLQKEDEANLVAVASRVNAALTRLNRDLGPDGIELVVTNSQAELMQEALSTLQQAALAGLFLGLVVLFLFLRNIRFVAVLLLAIPASLLATFNLMYAWDLSLNVISLCGLALAIGMLTDNSIVVLESIFSHFERGKPPLEAARDGSAEVSRAVIAATATTAMVFLPVVFIHSDYQDFLRQLALSITFPLLASLAVALTLVPAVAAHTLSHRAPRPLHTGALLASYTVLLKTGLRHRAAVGVAVALALLGTLVLSFYFILEQEQVKEESRFSVFVSFPEGTSLEKTDAAVRQVEAAIEKLPGVERYTAGVQEAAGTVTAILAERHLRPGGISAAEIKKLFESDLPEVEDAEIGFEPASSGGARGGGGGGTSFAQGSQPQSERALIKGYDFATLQMIAEDLSFRLEELEAINTNSVRADLQRGSAEIQVLPDPVALFDQGLRVNAVLGAITDASRQGSVTRTSFLNADGTEVPIEIRPPEPSEARAIGPQDVGRLGVETAAGTYLPVESLARVRTDQGRNGILRTDGARRIIVSYAFADELLESQPQVEAGRQLVRTTVQDMALPDGYTIEVVEYETDTAYYWMMGIAAVLTYMVLAALFESFGLPLIVFCTLPTAAIGSCWALILSGTGLSSQAGPMALLGFVVLIGIAVNNGIILIDAISALRQQQHFSRVRAVVAAGRSRVRPILMTSATTLLGVLPLSLEFGGDYEVWPPFALTVLGGLAVSMASTLILIPVAYMGLEQVKGWLANIGAIGIVGATAATAAATYALHLRHHSLFWSTLIPLPVWLTALGLAWSLVRLHRTRAEARTEVQIYTLHLWTLTKVYGGPGRFRREWERFERRTTRLQSRGIDPVDRHAVIDGLSWKIPLSVLVFFLCSYFTDSLWVYLSAACAWGLASHLTGQVAALSPASWRRPAHLAASYGLPLCFVAYVQWRLGLPSLSIASAAVWMAWRLLRYLGNRLRRGIVDPSRLAGRLYNGASTLPFSGASRPQFQALYGVNLEIGRGVFGLLGPNGAGKTTLMRILCQVLEPTSGSVGFNGTNIQHLGRIQGLIGYLPQHFGLYNHMSARQYLDYRALLEGFRDRRQREFRIDTCLEQVNLQEWCDEKIGSFSGGMKQRVGIAQTLLHMPQIIVVDEPTAGLDPVERIRFRNLLARVAQERIVIFSTHIVEDISGSCNNLAVLVRGRVLYQGSPTQMRRQAEGRVWEAVLPEKELPQLEARTRVIGHLRTPAGVRARFLAAEPVENVEAQQVEPTLEDAYLHLLDPLPQFGKTLKAC